MKCFIMMPFQQAFDEVYATIKRGVAAAVPGEAINALRLDEKRAAGKITDDLIQELQEADLCVADVTGSNPNVMWEVGFATALQKPTIPITQHADQLPFNVKDFRVIGYDFANLEPTLQVPLAEAVKETLAKYAVSRQIRAIKLPERTPRTIALTGSFNIPPNRAAFRIDKLVSPYLGDDVTWYIGSSGTTDETAAEYLLSRKQRVICVGYSALDVTPRMLTILERYNAPLVDAQLEQLPRFPGAPSDRDVLFTTRADLVILIWDGHSFGTGKILDWVRQQGKDHVVGFM